MGCDALWRVECPHFLSFLRFAPVSCHDRIRRQQLIEQAEGYLELGMPSHALAVLARLGGSDLLTDHALYLQGECLRSLDRFGEAVEPLARAAHGSPQDVHVWLALGWCHKRHRPARPGDRIARRGPGRRPGDALVHYNLACYWSLAKNKRKALSYLARAFDLKEEYRSLVAGESDFDPIRTDPAFKALVRVTV